MVRWRTRECGHLHEIQRQTDREIYCYLVIRRMVGRGYRVETWLHLLGPLRQRPTRVSNTLVWIFPGGMPAQIPRRVWRLVMS